MPTDYQNPGPTREEIDTSSGPLLLEFGTAWCGHCQLAAPVIATALADHPHVPHLQVEDGLGPRLGRSFCIKLWPTLIMLHNGQQIARAVRPTTIDEVHAVLAQVP
jgi:thioredoxin 1